jgi:hypothetical protein
MLSLLSWRRGRSTTSSGVRTSRALGPFVRTPNRGRHSAGHRVRSPRSSVREMARWHNLSTLPLMLQWPQLALPLGERPGLTNLSERIRVRRQCLKGALIPIVALTRGYPRAPFGWSGTPGTVHVIADGSLLRSGGETWGPVSPDNVEKTGDSPGPSQETRFTKSLVTGSIRVFVPQRLAHARLGGGPPVLGYGP